MEFSKLLKELREKKGFTQRQLARLAGINNTEISKIEKGVYKKPSQKTLKMLSKPLGISYEELLKAAGYYVPPTVPESYLVNQFINIPVYGEIRAGKPALVRDEIIDWIPISAEQIKGGEYFYLRVKGDSMKDEKIFDGDYVLVRLQPTLENGKIGIIGIIGDSAVEYGSEATIKKFYRKGNIAVLQPANPEYDPIIVPIKDVHIIGEVVKTERWVNGRHIR